VAKKLVVAPKIGDRPGPYPWLPISNQLLLIAPPPYKLTSKSRTWACAPPTALIEMAAAVANEKIFFMRFLRIWFTVEAPRHQPLEAEELAR
jgi:hypothetical protein